MKHRLAALLLAAPLLVAAPAGAQPLSVVFSYISTCDNAEPPNCDYIGQGNSDTWTTADGSWSVSRNFDNGISFFFLGDQPGIFWGLDFAAPDEVELSAGTYLSATRFPFQAAGTPALDVSGEGRGCNTLTGQFDVSDIAFDWFGEPYRFTASFVQHCTNPGNPPLTGDITFSRAASGPVAPTQGNLLVVVDNRLFEYQTDGTLVTEIPIGVSPGSPPANSEVARDLIVDGAGDVHLFNGTFSPVLSTLDSSAGTWQHNSFADWAITNNLSYGGVTAFGSYVFVTDSLTGSDGIVRFHAGGGFSGQRFPNPNVIVRDYIDLAMGFDGYLYALSDNETALDVFLPGSMAFVRQITLGNAVRGIAVNAQGKIFGASWDGNIYRFDSAGTNEAALDPSGVGSLQDIDLNRDGEIAATGGFDEIVAVTDESLGSASLITLPASSNGIFAAFVEPPPDPLFSGGDFETGNANRWSEVDGLQAGFLAINASAANSSGFGLEIAVGAVCSHPDHRLIDSPTTIQGNFFACQTITAEGVEVNPDALFVAGQSIALGNGFGVAAGATFGAALEGSLADGFPFVQDDSPQGLATYNSRFDLNLDSASLGDGDRLENLNGYSSNGVAHFRVILKRNAALAENRLIVSAREDSGTSVETSPLEEILLLADWRTVQIAWRAGAGNGELLVWVDGVFSGGLTGLDNDQAKIDFVRWGAAGGSLGGSSGTLHLDNFNSWQ